MSADSSLPLADSVEWAKALVAQPLTERSVVEPIELLRGPDQARAKMAAWALGNGVIPADLREGAIRALMDVLGDIAKPAEVRGQAAEAAAERLEFADHQDPLRSATEAQLVEMLDDFNPEVRFWSVFGLGTLRTATAVPFLRRLTADTALVPKWWTVGEEAVDAIDRIEGRQPQER